jgi:hypothetical protein
VYYGDIVDIGMDGYWGNFFNKWVWVGGGEKVFNNINSVKGGGMGICPCGGRIEGMWGGSVWCIIYYGSVYIISLGFFYIWV